MENLLSIRLRRSLYRIEKFRNEIQEIRLRSGQPMIICRGGKEWFLDDNGAFCTDEVRAVRVLEADIQESLAYICQYSLYAYADELRQGFITVRGGHRIGVAGQAALELGKIKSISCVSSLNIRIAHQIYGCGSSFFSYLWKDNIPCHTLIISPPGGGKTTLLRDFIRLFSNGLQGHPGVNVALVDERSEVGACYMGVPQNDVGIRTDVMANCPKAEGIEVMVRAMGPEIIAFDELGGEKDIEAVRYAVHSGCKVLTTMHGNCIDDVFERCGKNLFERYIFLYGRQRAGHICRILDAEGRMLYKAV